MKKLRCLQWEQEGCSAIYFLARALNKAGYDVVLGSHPCWKELRKSNVNFIPIGPDIDIEKEAAYMGKYPIPL